MQTITPERGDIVTVDLNPTRDHEQKGFRPVLVISHYDFNLKTGLVIICPITSKVRGNPFEIEVIGKKLEGVVLAHQVRTIDLDKRDATVCDRVTDFCLSEVIRKLALVIN